MRSVTLKSFMCFSLGAISLLTCLCGPAKGENLDEATVETTIRCVGRFELSLPVAFEEVRRVHGSRVLYNTHQGDDFCIAQEDFTKDLGETEKVYAKFTDRGTKTEIRIGSQKIGKGIIPSEPSYDISREQKSLAAKGLHAEIIIDAPRTVGGYTGREGCLRLSGADDDVLKYTWFTLGVENNGASPSIQIALTGRTKLKSSLDLIWNSLLQSYKPRRF